MYPSIVSLIGGLVLGSSGMFGGVVNTFRSFIPFSNSFIGDPVLSLLDGRYRSCVVSVETGVHNSVLLSKNFLIHYF